MPPVPVLPARDVIKAFESDGVPVECAVAIV